MTDTKPSRTKSLHALAQQERLERRGYSIPQAAEIVAAATPRLTLVVDDWITSLLKRHPPGILGLILSVSLYTVAVHKQEVRRGLLHLYDIRFPRQVSTPRMMEEALQGALMVLVARQSRGDFTKNSTGRSNVAVGPDVISSIAVEEYRKAGTCPRSRRRGKPTPKEEADT